MWAFGCFISVSWLRNIGLWKLSTNSYYRCQSKGIALELGMLSMDSITQSLKAVYILHMKPHVNDLKFLEVLGIIYYKPNTAIWEFIIHV